MKSKPIIQSLLFATLLVTLQACASGPDNNTLALDCANAMSTPDINACAKLALDLKEIELDQTYQHVLNQFEAISLSPSNGADKSKLKQQMIEAQRLWYEFRKAECDAIYTYWSDGTIRGVMYLSCMTEKANARILELKAYDKTY
jgi:uncharacterized protein YecT (DUF1311 family)